MSATRVWVAMDGGGVINIECKEDGGSKWRQWNQLGEDKSN